MRGPQPQAIVVLLGARGGPKGGEAKPRKGSCRGDLEGAEMDGKGTGRAQAGATLSKQERAGRMGLPSVLSQCGFELCTLSEKRVWRETEEALRGSGRRSCQHLLHSLHQHYTEKLLPRGPAQGAVQG